MQTLQLLQSEKELQSGGEVKELADAADKLSKRLVKDTTAWTNKKENLDTDQATCQQACLCSCCMPWQPTINPPTICFWFQAA